MSKFENQVLIDRPVFDVFKFVADFTNDSDWRNVANIGITSGDPIRTGSMVAMTRPILGRKGFVNADVITYDRNKKIELKGSFWGFPFLQTVTFEHRGQQTNVHETIEISTRWMIWYSFFFSVTLNGTFSKEWAKVKQILDSRGERKPV